MRKENVVSANVGELNGRITRARAAALRASGQLPPLNAPNQPDQKRVLRANTKRTALDENNTNAPDSAGLQRKKRAVLQDVTNVCCNNSYRKCFNTTKIQVNIPSLVNYNINLIVVLHVYIFKNIMVSIYENCILLLRYCLLFHMLIDIFVEKL